MATYFPSSNNQTDAGTFLSFRQSLPGSYSEAPIAPGSMMMFMNYSSSSASYSDTFVGTSQAQNGCIDIPPVRDSDSNASQQEILSNPEGSRIGIHDFTTWKGSRNEMLMMHPVGGADSVMQVAQNMQGQGLSLSLGSHLPPEIEISHVQCQNPNQGFTSLLSHTSAIPGEGSGGNAYFGDDDDNSHTKQQRNAYYLPPGYPGSNSNIMKADISPYGMSSYSSTARAFPNAKYLKAAQQLLDEVVNIGKAVKEHNFKKELIKHSKGYDADLKSKSSDPPAAGSCSNPQDLSNHQSELSATEKLEVQNKMTKLLSMLDEIDQRYRQYYHQMQIVISSFDVIAGDGAAKPYTALALQTISRHFRCLRDAISIQIRALRKSLGEQDASDNSNGIGISRLRYVDQQLRQQRALQQLGMMQQHTWRPQRGLPESSVSILRAWLFEHFLHPYPKDSDKIMLARQTGLTRSQVSNWFINARVRLWKPMVEKIYKEENCDIEMDSNASSEVASRIAIEDAKVEEREEFQHNATSAEHERYISGQKLESGANCFNDVEMEGAINEETQSESAMDGCSLVPDTFVQDRFMSLPGRFGSGVSLTLGLQRGEGGSLPMSNDSHVSYAPTRGDAVYDTSLTTMDPETEEFNCLDSGNRQNRFCSSQLLHDFVA